MLIQDVECTSCSAHFIVDQPLWQAGIQLHCPECGTYFLPPDAPRRYTAEEVCKASVPIRIWTPSS